MKTKRPNKRLCDVLREYRKNCQMTQADVADYTGCTRSNVTQLEAGTHPPTLVYLRKFADLMRVDYRELLKDVA